MISCFSCARFETCKDREEANVGYYDCDVITDIIFCPKYTPNNNGDEKNDRG